MFGCGKFDEVRVLSFLDGKRDEEIENHIMECDECLDELIELNRINSTIEGSDTKSFRAKNFVILRETKGGFDLFTNLGFSKLKEIGVRKDATEKSKIFTSRLNNIEISISFVEKGFAIYVDCSRIKNFKLQLIRRGETLPIFSKSGSYEKVCIKGIENGKYELKINEEVVSLNIKDTGIGKS